MMETVPNELLPTGRSFRVEIEITSNRLKDILISAFEQGIGYWASNVDFSSYDDIVSGRQHAVITEREGGKQHMLSRNGLINALSVMSRLKNLEHFTNTMTGDWDCVTGDVLVQCAIFSEIVYG